MTRYMVNGSVDMSAWVYVEADTPEQALEEARDLDLRSGWEYDDGTAKISLHGDPVVEEAS